MGPLLTFFVVALLGVALGWFGLGGMEWPAILLGTVIVGVSATRVHDSETGSRAWWVVTLVLGASIYIAGVFDLFDIAQSAPLGDWNTGFILALIIFSPFAFRHIWLSWRKGKTPDHERDVVSKDVAIARREERIAERSARKRLHAFFISSLLALGLGWFGFRLVEAGAIFLGAVIVVFAAERADDADFARRSSAGWVYVMVLGASIAIAAAFDLFNAGRDTALGDWDTGFIVGLALLGPIALVHTWKRWRKTEAPKREEAGLVALVIGVVLTDLIFYLLADDRSMTERVGTAGIAATVGFGASMIAQIRAGGAPVRARQVGDAAAAILFAAGLELPSISILPPFLLLGAAWGVAVLGVRCSSFERVQGRVLGVIRRSTVTGVVGALLLYVLAFGAIAPRVDAGVATIVAALDDIMPLPHSLFVRLIMSDRYLWAGVPPVKASDIWREPRDLIRALRNPADRWSGIIPAATSNAELNGEYNYGLDFVEEGGVTIVTHVHPESAAAKAGVKRGWRLDIPGGEPVSRAMVSFTDPDGNRHDVERSNLGGKVSPSWWNVTDHAGHKVAYLYLSGFYGSNRDLLSSSFAEFKREGVEELVLDLRYNSGGSLGIAIHLASLIAGPELEGKVFQRAIHNQRYGDKDMTALFRRHAEALSLKRVFVLTTRDTCSASEAVIMGLAPHIEVITIGVTTCGKPVGFTPIDFRGMSYWVMDFSLRNAADQGDYFDGLAPTCQVKEDLRQTLGSPDEALFSEALYYMSTGRCNKS